MYETQPLQGLLLHLSTTIYIGKKVSKMQNVHEKVKQSAKQVHTFIERQLPVHTNATYHIHVCLYKYVYQELLCAIM